MKNTENPKVSFIVCTYSTKEHPMRDLIMRCLRSIFALDYPKEQYEVICVDGGSDAETIQEIKKFPIKFVRNYKRFPEGKGMGKSQGMAQASGDFIAFVDHDNMLSDKDWLKQMLLPMLKDATIFGSDCRTAVLNEKSITNKYLSYIGTDPFAAEMSLQGLSGLNKLHLEDCGEYATIKIRPDKFFITGGNCFVYRRSAIESVGGYTKDIDIVYKLAKLGFAKVAVPKKAATHHQAVRSFTDFIKKKILWAKVQVRKKEVQGEFSWLPNTNQGFAKLFIKILCNLIILPNLPITIKRLFETHDAAWIMHPIATFATTLVYVSVWLTENILPN